MSQEWLEAAPSDGMDILYTGAPFQQKERHICWTKLELNDFTEVD